MLVIPAIDIEGGRVVRGEGPPADPLVEAAALRDAGARWLHVVDMDRAFGAGTNDEIVQRIASLRGLQVQVGGGFAHPAPVRLALAWGAARVAVGPALVEPAGLPADRLALNVDLREGRVWPRGAPAPLAETARELVDCAVVAGIRVVICRDLARDGALGGADLAAAAALTERGADVFVAGGVARLEELEGARDAGLAGVIVGRALHAGRLRIEEALAWSA